MRILEKNKNKNHGAALISLRLELTELQIANRNGVRLTLARQGVYSYHELIFV